MKIAFYVDEGREQVVLTPESDFEKAILGKLRAAASNPTESPHELLIETGQFYRCQGGWTRHGSQSQRDSLFIVLDHRSPIETKENDNGCD